MLPRIIKKKTTAGNLLALVVNGNKDYGIFLDHGSHKIILIKSST